MTVAQPLDTTGARRDAFMPYNLDTLVSGAARLRPENIAFADRVRVAPFGIVAAQVAALARILSECGLQPGERILLAGGAEISLAISAIAALRGGFIPALAPLDLEPETLAAYAQEIGAAAIAGPPRYGDLDPLETCMAAAAQAPAIRLVASFGPAAPDGAVDLSAEAILKYAAAHPDPGLERGRPIPAEPPRLITYDRRRARPVAHQQATLIAAGLDFVAQARIGRGTPILSTLPPTSFAGFVTGPCAALLSGAPLYLHGPFSEEDFLAARAQAEHAHLILPAALAADFAGIFDGLAAAVLVSRLDLGAAPALPPPVAAPCPLVDLYAFDESCAIAEPRQGSFAVPPVAAPHFIGFDESRLLTVAQDGAGAALAFKGAAVTETP